MQTKTSVPRHSFRPYASLRAAALLSLFGLVAAATLAGCQQRVEAGSPQIATVTRRDIVEQIPLNGQLVVPPPAQASVAAPFTATVERIYRSVGQKVSRGDTLLKLTVPTADAYHQQARIELEQARDEYQRVQGQYQPPVSQARQRLADAEAAVRQARQSPGQGGDASASQDGEQTGGGGPDGSSLQQALQQQQEARRDLDQAKRAMARALAPYRDRIARAERSAAQARIADSQGAVRAPITGVVTVLNAQPGRQVDPQQDAPLATVVDLDALQVQAPMSADQAARVQKGMKVALSFDELPAKTFDGTVRQITTTPTGGYVAVVTFRNTDWQVKPGCHPHADILTGRSVRAALAVPASAVAPHDGGWVVDTPQNGKWIAAPVQPGISDGLFTAIKSGVQEGQQVEVPAKG